MPRQARHDTIMLPCHCELTPIRHCERSEAISDGLSRAHALAKTEVGRSMVEMLGVLAIMGIVGMVGVKMYTSAMNKHKANELIYEAQKRATMVAMQITAGQENLSVANFTNPTGYTFGVEKNPQNANQFNITIMGVGMDVCEHMKIAVGPATPIRVISEFCDKLTFNNDLSTTGYTSDYTMDATGCQNAGYTWCAKGDNVVVSKCSESSNCCMGVSYHSQCQTCNASTGEITNKSGSCTYTYANGSTATGTCDSGICLDPAITTTTLCLTNADCGGVGSGYFCKYTKTLTNTEDVFQAMGCPGENNPLNCDRAGTCTPIGTVMKANVAGLGQVIVGPNGSWWSSKNWCEAQGKSLFEVAQMQVYEDGETLVQTGRSVEAQIPACAKDKACSDWNKLWKIKGSIVTLLNTQDENGEPYRLKFSPIVVSLGEAFLGYRRRLWLGTNAGTLTDDRRAYVVNLEYGELDTTYRNYSSSWYPLCQ